MRKLIAAAAAACALGMPGGAQSPSASANIAGTLYASSFASWIVPKGDAGAFAWSTRAACTVSSNGVTFPAFSVGTPVMIVDSNSPTSSEIVIPTAVTITPTSCTINVTPGRNHYSFYLTTATAGLQEALNYAGAQPYVVALTSDWTRFGGQTSMITKAHGTAAVSISDQRTAMTTAYAWNGNSYYGVASASSGLLDPGANGILLRQGVNSTAIAKASDIAALGTLSNSTTGNAASASLATQAIGFVNPPAGCPSGQAVNKSDTGGNALICIPAGNATGVSPTGNALTQQLKSTSGALTPGIQMGNNGLDQTNPGAFQATRTNYAVPATLPNAYPQLSPYVLATGEDARYGQNDNPYGLIINQNVGSGFETFLGQTYGNNTNNTGLNLNVVTRGPIQNGGVFNENIFCNGTDDCVNFTALQLCTGTDRGDNEGGCEFNRVFLGYQHGIFGGPATIFSADGNHGQIRVGFQNGYDLTQAAGGRVLIDLTKKFAPAGNVSTVGRYTDARFATVTLDSTMQSAVGSQFGTTSAETTLVAGADGAKYDGNCPATLVSSSWGTVPETIDGNSVQVAIDPYNPNPATGGSRTLAQCLIVKSTAGFAAGQMIGIWGAQNNYEYEIITKVVDSVHMVVPLDHPHDPGELITAGAGLGWALSTPRNDYPAGYLTDSASTQFMPQHEAYPIMRVNGATVELYTNSAGTQGQAELHLNLYQSLVPAAPLSFTGTTSGGVLTGITGSSATDQYGNYFTANPNLSGPLTVLPPPTLSFNCTTQPVVQLQNAATFSYVPLILSGGSGCPATSSLVITTAATYTNPAVFYPVTKTFRIEDPTYGCTANGVQTANCPTSGYLKTGPLPATFASNDVVEITPHWNQYIADQINLNGSVETLRSSNEGPMGFRTYRFAQSGQPLMYEINTTPDWYYFGRAANNFSRLITQDPTQVADATLQPPVYRELGNAYSGIFKLDQIPMRGLGTTQGGAAFEVDCIVGAPNSTNQNPPCARGVRPDYDLWYHHMSNVGGVDLHMSVSDASSCFKLNGNCAVTKDASGAITAGNSTTTTNGGIVLAAGSAADTYDARCSGVTAGQWCVTIYQGAPAFIKSDGGIYAPTLTRVATAPGRTSSLRRRPVTRRATLHRAKARR